MVNLTGSSKFHVLCLARKTKRKLGEIVETGSPEESTQSVEDSAKGDASEAQDNNDDEKRGETGTSEEMDDSLTPAQRRFREKQLEREVGTDITTHADILLDTFRRAEPPEAH